MDFFGGGLFAGFWRSGGCALWPLGASGCDGRPCCTAGRLLCCVLAGGASDARFGGAVVCRS
jgi:hypothetical protein